MPTVLARLCTDWPESKSGAEVWEGLPRNLGGPVLTDSDSRGCRGLMRDQAHAEVSAEWERTGVRESERGSESNK